MPSSGDDSVRVLQPWNQQQRSLSIPAAFAKPHRVLPVTAPTHPDPTERSLQAEHALCPSTALCDPAPLRWTRGQAAGSRSPPRAEREVNPDSLIGIRRSLIHQVEGRACPSRRAVAAKGGVRIRHVDSDAESDPTRRLRTRRATCIREPSAVALDCRKSRCSRRRRHEPRPASGTTRREHTRL